MGKNHSPHDPHSITRPNFAQDRRTILCLHVLGFQKLIYKHVPKCKWIPQTKFQWIPHTYTCNVNFAGTFVLSPIQQQAKIASCFGFRNCKWIPQNENGIPKCKWILQTVSGFRILLNTELVYEQLKARAGLLISNNAEFKSEELTIVSGINEQVSKHWLPKSVVT